MNAFRKKTAMEMRNHLIDMYVSVPAKCTKSDMINLFKLASGYDISEIKSPKRKIIDKTQKNTLDNYIKRYKKSTGEPLDLEIAVDGLKSEDGDDMCIIAAGGNEYAAIKKEKQKYKIIGSYRSPDGETNTLVKLEEDDIPILLTNRLDFDVFSILKNPEI